jgi:stage V sporulation protein D (sporulation-specific penicillin-binding protein)
MGRASQGTGGNLRLDLVKLVCLGVCLILVARLVQVQIVQHAQHREAAERQWLQARTITPHRGDLMDRAGRPLALTVSSFRVGVSGSLVKDREALETTLAEVLALDRRQVARQIDAARGGHAVLARQAFLDQAQQRRLRRFAAVTIDEQIGRVYPLDGVGASLIGFYREDPDSNRHRTGLELGLDGLLRGEPGRAMRVRSGLAGQDHGEVEVKPARHGDHVVLTIDADLQEICESRLRESVRETGSAAGSVLILDPRTGDILAAASWPLVETRAQPVRDPGCWINRNLTTAYEPGSVFKIFTAATLLCSGAIDTATVYDCTSTRFEGFTIREASGKSFARLNFMEAFAHSSNVWFARAVANLTRQEQHRALLDFGFGRGTGAPYPAEGDGILAAPADWSARSQATIAIGQEIATTPLQLGLAAAAVANGGTLYAPRLYREVRAPDGTLRRVEPPRPLRQVLPRGLDRLLRLAMGQVVREGTGTAVARPWIEVGGKTGTAQKSVPGRGYADGLHTATFLGFLPLHDPRLVIVTVLDEPRWSHHYASRSAAPLFGAVVDDIRRTTDWLTDVDASSQRLVVGPEPALITVPDVVLLDSERAALRLRQAGLQVEGAERRGQVIMQVPAAGSRLAHDSVVSLTTARGLGDQNQASPDVRGLSNREVLALAARLGVPVRITGVGYAQEQQPPPGEQLTTAGLQVRMGNPWR